MTISPRNFHFHVVLVEPEIPPNTGNVGRLCVATESVLHLVGPLGFAIDDKQVRRAGLDYWKHVQLIYHENLEAWFRWRAENFPDLPCYFFEVGSTLDLFKQQSLPHKAALFFGKESTGLPQNLLSQFPETHLSLPMFSDKIRSLNLSNTVSIALYEFIRRTL